MASQNTNPFYGSSSGGIPASGNQQRLNLDNLLRRELRIGDPNDSKQIAQALLDRYKDDPRANAITQEARGLPFLLDTPTQVPIARAATSCETELKQAVDDVDSDLQELTTNTLLKDSASELRGWGQAIRNLIAEGTVAARFGLDTRQRDKVFSIRRQLGDYARLARIIGALTPSLNATFRSFAKSLDEVSSVFLVMMGEALANVGFNGGRFLLQVPYTELQVRREAAIAALRNLTGSTQVSSFYQNDWQWGLNAYRKLYKFLDDQGQGDLRVLLMENELARAMDELIQRAAHGTVDGLRALGATAEVDLDRFRRLIAVGNHLQVDSPPLSAFFDALLLFVQSFDAAGGFRLLRIARPPVLFYGLYGTSFASLAEKRLLDLIMARGLLADQADCYLQCSCSDGAASCQIMIDKVLYDVDRAIDLYTVGESEWGEPEIRAAAYGFLAKKLLEEHNSDTSPCNADNDSPVATKIQEQLQKIADKLIPNKDGGSWGKDVEDLTAAVLGKNPTWQTLMKSELCNQYNREIQGTNSSGLRRIVETIAPSCISLEAVFNDLKDLMNGAIELIEQNHTVCPPLDVTYPMTPASSGQQRVLTEYVNLSKKEQLDFSKIKIDPSPLFRFSFPVIKINPTPVLTATQIDESVPLTTEIEYRHSLSNEEEKMLEISRLVKTLSDVKDNNNEDKRAIAIAEFERFANDNTSFLENLHLKDNFEKVVETFNKIPTLPEDERTQIIKSLNENCIRILGVVGLGIKR